MRPVVMILAWILLGISLMINESLQNKTFVSNKQTVHLISEKKFVEIVFRDMISILLNGKPKEKVLASMYKWTGYRTYSGEWPYEGSIAIRFESPKIRKLGLRMKDRVWLEGAGLNGVYIIEDRLPDWHQGRDIDIYSEASVPECFEFGLRHVTMTVI